MDYNENINYCFYLFNFYIVDLKEYFYEYI